MLLYYQDQVLTTGESNVEETLLEGHLGITRELLAFQSAEKKFQMGSQQGGANLIKVSLHLNDYRELHR
jgi:ubiquitin carboxyl-terminal hydrolase 9/24